MESRVEIKCVQHAVDAAARLGKEAETCTCDCWACIELPRLLRKLEDRAYKTAYLYIAKIAESAASNCEDNDVAG